MKRTSMAAKASLALSAGLLSAATVLAAPAYADPALPDLNGDGVIGVDPAQLPDLNGDGVVGLDPAAANQVGQDVCPLLAQPGQEVADAAAQVADGIGRPLGPAPMFTGLAITLFCPGAVASLANGQSPIPLGLLGG